MAQAGMCLPSLPEPPSPHTARQVSARLAGASDKVGCFLPGQDLGGLAKGCGNAFKVSCCTFGVFICFVLLQAVSSSPALPLPDG